MYGHGCYITTQQKTSASCKRFENSCSICRLGSLSYCRLHAEKLHHAPAKPLHLHLSYPHPVLRPRTRHIEANLQSKPSGDYMTTHDWSSAYPQLSPHSTGHSSESSSAKDGLKRTGASPDPTCRWHVRCGSRQSSLKTHSPSLT